MASKLSSAEKRIQKDLLATLRELGGKLKVDDGITYRGKEFVIPETVSLDRAIRTLIQKQAELEEETSFVKTFNYRPWDGAYCMLNALRKTFGPVAHQGTPGGFFSPDMPPRMITVPSGVGETVQVPWGRFELPLLDGVLFETDMHDHDDLGALFKLSVTGAKKYEGEILGVFSLIEEELRTNSMYRGKAFDGQSMPEFVDLSGIDPELVVYSEDVMRQLETELWARLRYTAEYEREGKPLKRSVLVHGPFGTGKTLALALTGQVAVANGWTFIKGRPGRDNLDYVMQTARLYQPCVVCYEDLDQLADPSSNTENHMTRLLDDFDGIDAKGTKIICVLTTNYPERIQQGMGRPGRLDSMIKINDLDLAGISKLVQVTVGEHRLADEIDWQAVYNAAAGYKPAFVTELAGRAGDYAMVRNGGTFEGIRLATEDLVYAAQALRPQYELHIGAANRHEKPRLELALHNTITEALRDNLDAGVLAENGRP